MAIRVITQKVVQERYVYDPETGVFTYRVARPGRLAGAVAGSKQPNGYTKLCIDGFNTWAHRVAWLYVHGDLPKYVDHINGDKSDNRIANLRSCNMSRNIANSKRRWDNSTGFKGVSLRKDTGKYQVFLTVNYKRKALGCYDTAEEAHAAYMAAARKHFGDFARSS